MDCVDRSYGLFMTASCSHQRRPWLVVIKSSLASSDSSYPRYDYHSLRSAESKSHQQSCYARYDFRKTFLKLFSYHGHGSLAVCLNDLL